MANALQQRFLHHREGRLFTGVELKLLHGLMNKHSNAGDRYTPP